MAFPNSHASDNASVLGPTLRFKGDLFADEDLQIHGEIEGNITHTKYLTICKEGNVKADIQGHIIAVHGSVEGNLVAATSVAISDTGHLTGDIRAPSISINDGADFNGKVMMEIAKPKAGTSERKASGVSGSDADASKE